MKLYFIGVFVVIGLIAIGGFVLPALFSAASTEAVLLGVGVVVIVPVILYRIGRSVFLNKSEITK